MPSFTMTHTAQEVADYVKRQFGDESGVQVTDTDIIHWINNATRDIYALKEPIKSIATAATVANQAQYSWPSNILQVQSLRVNNKPLRQMTFQEAERHVLDNDPNGTAIGEPEIWYEYGGQFFLYPKPSGSKSDAIQIFYIPAPDMISTILENLHIPDPLFNALLDHVLGQAYEMDENFEAAQLKAQSFGEYMNADVNGDVEPDFYPFITISPEDL